MTRTCLFLVCFGVCLTVVHSLEGTQTEDKTATDFSESSSSIKPESNAIFVPVKASIHDSLLQNNATNMHIFENGSRVNFTDDDSNTTFIDFESIPKLSPSGNRRLGSSRYKSGRQKISLSELTISDNVPRHGAILHKTVVKYEKSDKNVNDDVAANGNGNENVVKRKKRVETSSATPSVQIVVMVIGAVIGCVLLTGFIRWRVRGRLNAGKKGNSEDDYVIYESGSVYTGNIDMDTIYECECEEGQAMLRSHDRFGIKEEEEKEGLKLADYACSHRFNSAAAAFTSQSYKSGHNARFLRPDSDKYGRDTRVFRGPKRYTITRRKYGNRGRYLKHQKRRLENMFIQTLETIPMENSVPGYEDNEGNGSRGLTDGRLGSPSSSQTPSRHGSPTFRRSALASLFNTWRSFSFNRDWVGKVWQEQHNIRRLSDVLRGLSAKRNSVSSDRSSRGSVAGDCDAKRQADNLSGRLSMSSNSDVSECGQEVTVVSHQNSVGLDAESYSCDQMVAGGSEHAENVFTDGDSADLVSSRSDFLSRIPACIPERDDNSEPNGDRRQRSWSFSDHGEDPPEYESLLSPGDRSRSPDWHNSSDHRRYQRDYPRQLLDGLERPTRLFNRSVCDTFMDSNDGFTVSTHEPSHVTRIHGNQPVLDRSEHSYSLPLIMPAYQPELGQEDEDSASHGSFTNTVDVTQPVAPYAPPEGVIIELHSDGSQIVYIPPAALPSYHNDTPPPYQQ